MAQRVFFINKLREGVDPAAYERFVQDLVRTRNQTRQKRFVLEREQLHPLPAAPLAPCRSVPTTSCGSKRLGSRNGVPYPNRIAASSRR